jgi:hypothetical protein
MEENTTAELAAQGTPQPKDPQAAPTADPTQDKAAPTTEQNASEQEAAKASEVDDADEKADEGELPEETWLTDTELPTSYNWAWREVIKGLMDRKPAYQAYAEAYDIDIKEESGRRIAEANSSRLLRNDKFRTLWRKVLTEAGFYNETVDNELVKLMTDPTVHPSIRRAALRDFNELHGRIINKIDHTTKGKEIKAPVILSPIGPRDVGTEAETI